MGRPQKETKSSFKNFNTSVLYFYKPPNPLHIETSINQNFLDRTHCYTAQLPNYGGIMSFPTGVIAAAQPGRIGAGCVFLDGEKAHTQNSNYRFC